MASAKVGAKGSADKKQQHDRPMCEGETKTGRPCPNHAKPGEKVCGRHMQDPPAGGRETKFDEGAIAGILNWLRQGSYLKAAAESQGISETTIHRWLEEGKADDTAGLDSPKREFREQVTRARAEGEVRLVGYAIEAAKTDGRVAIEMLARRNPKQWGRKRLEVTGADGGALEHTERASINYDKLPLEKRRQLLALLDEAGAPTPNEGDT